MFPGNILNYFVKWYLLTGVAWWCLLPVSVHTGIQGKWYWEKGHGVGYLERGRWSWSIFTSQYGFLGPYSLHHLCKLLLLMLCQIASKNNSRKTTLWFIVWEHLVHSSGEDRAAGTWGGSHISFTVKKQKEINTDNFFPIFHSVWS